MYDHVPMPGQLLPISRRLGGSYFIFILTKWETTSRTHGDHDTTTDYVYTLRDPSRYDSNLQLQEEKTCYHRTYGVMVPIARGAAPATCGLDAYII
jgi:hypothetical protein